MTIEDVAREAGVSISTVSRVLNNNYPVKTETREKVEKAISLLNFSPNYLARGLVIKTTYTIGVLVPSITNSFFTTVVNGIQDYMQEKSYSILLCDTGGKCENEVQYIKNFIERRVDGIIGIDPQTTNIKNGFYKDISKHMPLVLVNGYDKKIKCNFVLNNQEKGTYEALQYLISLGHKRIAFLRGGDSYSYDLKQRVYKKILKEHNIDVKNNILKIESGNSAATVEMSAKIVEHHFKAKKPPTALFACNDWMAIGALHGAKKLNINIPNELSIVGYDNIIVSEISIPRLTTVDQNMYRLGEVSADMLYNLFQNKKDQNKKVILDTKLIIRESCKSLTV